MPTNKGKRTGLIIIGIIVALLIVGVFIRAVRNREGVRGILKLRSGSQISNITNTTNTTNSTNTTTNSTTNTTTNSTPTNTTTNSTGGGSTTTSKSKYPAGKTSISLDFGGITRTAIIFVPKSYVPGTEMPLVLNLHGSESTAEGQENNSHMDSTAEANGFIVVYPNGVNKEWNDGRSYTKDRTGNADDVGFIKKLVETVSNGLNTNSHKVYAVGMSNGGMMAHRLACDATSTFAAIGDVAGAMPTDLKNTCRPSGKIPVMIIHGTTDPIVPINGGDLKSGRGSVLAASDAVKYWAGINGVSGQVSSAFMADTVNDGTGLSLTHYGNTVYFYEVVNGGHTWPGGLQYLPRVIIGNVSRDMDASKVLWDFFKQFSR